MAPSFFITNLTAIDDTVRFQSRAARSIRLPTLSSREDSMIYTYFD